MTGLAAAAADYLTTRRALGFKLHHEGWWLPDFVAYVAAQGESVITADLALRWAQQPPGTGPNWWAHRLSAIRRFARHHRASDPRTEIPPLDLLPYRERRQIPYIYAEVEVTALLQQARRLPHPLTAATYATLLGLLAATGMRVGEAIALDRCHVDWDGSRLTVVCGKFGKSRDLPVHPSTIAALREYARVQQRAHVRRVDDSLFISRAGTRVLHQNFHHVFLRLVVQADIGRHRRRPRLHDLRHTFAVRTLRDWYRAGVDVEQRLPWLSTYLGHVNPTSTYWYLTATPELLALAARRLERFSRVKP